jgi:hypothetical protein
VLAARVSLASAALALAGCTDWRSLYVSVDAAVMVEPMADAPDAPPAPPPVDAPAFEVVEAPQAIPDTPPARDRPPPTNPDEALVFWRFFGAGHPSPTNPVPDLSTLAPDLPLQWDLKRDVTRSELRDGSVWFDGGFLRAGPRESDSLGAALVKKNSLTIEMWLRTVATESGTIMSTDGEGSGRAFSIDQENDTIHFSVRTTATDANGEHFGSNTGPTSELSGKPPFDPSKQPTVFHVVAEFSGADKASALYINGVLAQALSHVRPPTVLMPTLVWSTGKNEIGVGAPFNPAGASWKGLLMAVAIYDKPLPPDEVRRLFGLGPNR